MAEENSVTTALYRLARLETRPIRSIIDLLYWYRLRRWVLKDSRLLRQYQEQHYFSCADEVTKTDITPKKSSSMFPRLGNTPRLGNLLSRFRAFFK
jgi:hypothetical protein